MQRTTIPTSSKEKTCQCCNLHSPCNKKPGTPQQAHGILAIWPGYQVTFMTERLSLFGGALLPFPLWYNDPVQVTRAATQPVVSSHM